MREKIRMQSTESAHFYTRHKNKRLHPEKMTLNMYDPYIRKHCKYTEQKIKKWLLNYSLWKERQMNIRPIDDLNNLFAIKDAV